MPCLIPRCVPTRATAWAVAGLALGCAVALCWGFTLDMVTRGAAFLFAVGVVWAAADLAWTWRRWRQTPLQWQRPLPPALALGVPKVIHLSLSNPGAQTWRVTVFDDVDGKLQFEGLPQTARVVAGQGVTLSYRLTPKQRGAVQMGRTSVRLRSLGGLFELGLTLGASQRVHVYPNFAAVARYAWLAGDRRLAQIGIKSYPQRGLGTDFKQLVEYRPGDPVRHIDWKASLRHKKPVVREFQDERDQRVMFLLDCGRRMRADEGSASADGSHFDQALNALMLLSHVALKEGDEVGVMTFGAPDGQERHFAPRKGASTLNALMATLYDIEPGVTHADFLQAAQQLLRRQPRRSLVILLTNFRDEDATELAPALKLLRSRHLVLVASLRERVLRELGEQAMPHAQQVFEVATAHLFEQTRQDSFRQVVGRDALSVDVEPAHLAVTLVNRYHAVKRAGLL